MILNNNRRLNDYFLASMAYMLFFPSLYIILTEKRKSDFNVSHAANALILWGIIVLLFILLRLIYVLIIAITGYIQIYDFIIKIIIFLMWGYAIYCGILTLRRKDLETPKIFKLIKKSI